MTLDRKFFAGLLRQSLQELAEKQGRDILFAAPLANLVQQHLRRRLANETIELNGSLYGPALFPDLPQEEHARVKFRNFLEMFPDLVEVFRGPSGDMVRILKMDRAVNVDELRALYRNLLRSAMQDLTRIRGEPTVPAIQLAKWLRKRQPDFDTKKLGCASLVDWLETEKAVVEVNHREFGGRVRLVTSANLEQQSLAAAPQVPSAYLVVDSLDMLSKLHEMLGAKPGPGQLPDWGQLLRYLKQRSPALEWKGRYFMSLGKPVADSTEGLRKYLEAVGFKVIQLALEVEPSSLPEAIQARVAANRVAVAKMLSALIRREAHVFVVSHSDANAFPLSKLLEAKPPAAQVGIVGFPEHLPDSLVRLRVSGLQMIDVEKDARAFKQPLARRQLLTLDTFDPSQFL